jgi:hypothetical protein
VVWRWMVTYWCQCQWILALAIDLMHATDGDDWSKAANLVQAWVA